MPKIHELYYGYALWEEICQGRLTDTFTTGWLVICGWQALVASSAYLSGNMILTLVTMNHSSFVWTQWQSTLVYWAIMTLAILVNMYSSTLLPKLEFFILALHILGFFAFLIPLVYVSTLEMFERWIGH